MSGLATKCLTFLSAYGFTAEKVKDIAPEEFRDPENLFRKLEIDDRKREAARKNTLVMLRKLKGMKTEKVDGRWVFSVGNAPVESDVVIINPLNRKLLHDVVCFYLTDREVHRIGVVIVPNRDKEIAEALRKVGTTEKLTLYYPMGLYRACKDCPGTWGIEKATKVSFHLPAEPYSPDKMGTCIRLAAEGAKLVITVRVETEDDLCTLMALRAKDKKIYAAACRNYSPVSRKVFSKFLKLFIPLVHYYTPQGGAV